MSESAFDRWWGEDNEPDYEGVRQAAMDAWEASREACAATAEAAGCLGCWTLEGPLSDHAPGSDHIAQCPIAIAARLRGLA